MRLVVDLQACQFNGRFRGIGRYALNLFEHMVEVAGKHEIIACLSDTGADAAYPLFERLATIMPRENIRVWSSIPGISDNLDTDKARRRKRHACLIRDAFIASLRPDVVHTASLFEGFGDDTAVRIKSPEGLDTRTAVTLYDLIPLVRPGEYLPNPVIQRWYHDHVEELNSAGMLLAISEASRREAIDHLSVAPGNIVTISSGVDPMFVPWERCDADEAAFRRKYGLAPRFFLYTGGFDFRKNLSRLVQAWASLPERKGAQLVFAGLAEPTAVAHLVTLAKTCGLPDDALKFLGYVSDEDLIRLYSTTLAFVFPSMHEGFGLPILEAMACGAAVIAADATSLPEVVGFKDALFDPLSVESIAGKMQRVLMDADFRRALCEHASLQRHRFTWKDSAESALGALEELAARQCPPKVRIVKIEHFESGDTSAKKLMVTASDAVVCPSEVLLGDDCLLLVSGGPDSDHTRHPSRVLLAGADSVPSRSSLKDIYGVHGYAIAAIASAVGSAEAATPLGWIPEQSIQGVVLPPQLARKIPLSRSDFRYAHDWRSFETTADTADRVISFATDVHLHGARALMERLVARFAGDMNRDSRHGPPDNEDRIAFSRSVAINHPDGFRKTQILVDVSELVHQDQATGIQRVVRRVLAELLDWRKPNLRVEPVYFGADGRYRYAAAFVARFLGFPEPLRDDASIDYAAGDIFVGLDLAQQCVVRSQDWFKRMRVAGVQVYFVVYDLLPWLRSEFFHPAARANFEAWLRAIYSAGDGLLCISRAVADELIENLDGLAEPTDPRKTPLKIGYFHLGADLDADVARRGTSREESAVAAQIPDDQPLVLMVSTLEPRKGYKQALEAFELLWNQGETVSLVIVGKRGWLVDQFADRLRQHPQWRRQLFWFEAASDGLLQELYRRATVLLAASEGEGFGLPLIEAAQLGVPLLCRDLPVFQEVAGTNATYFSGRSPDALAKAISAWMNAFETGAAIPSGRLEWQTWRASTLQLMNVILQSGWYAEWQPGTRLSYASFSTRFGTQVGALQHGCIGTTGEGGVLMHGPYVPAARGIYRLHVYGRLGIEATSAARVELAHGNGAQLIEEFRLRSQSRDSVIVDEEFILNEDVGDLEVRIWVGDGDVMTVGGIEITAESGSRLPTVRYHTGVTKSTTVSPGLLSGEPTLGEQLEGETCG